MSRQFRNAGWRVLSTVRQQPFWEKSPSVATCAQHPKQASQRAATEPDVSPQLRARRRGYARRKRPTARHGSPSTSRHRGGSRHPACVDWMVRLDYRRGKVAALAPWTRSGLDGAFGSTAAAPSRRGPEATRISPRRTPPVQSRTGGSHHKNLPWQELEPPGHGVGRSRGGLTTKIHQAVDRHGRRVLGTSSSASVSRGLGGPGGSIPVMRREQL